MKHILFYTFLFACLFVFGGNNPQITTTPTPKAAHFWEKVEKIEAFLSFDKVKAFFSPQHIQEMGPDFWIPFGLSILLATPIFIYILFPFLTGAAFITAAAAAGKAVIGGLVALVMMIILVRMGTKVLEMPQSERNKIKEESRRSTEQYYREHKEADRKYEAERYKREMQRLQKGW